MLLQDASVVGKVFWTGAVRGDGDVTRLLHTLERKGFLTRQRSSSVESEGEWSFAHMLLRDVAYAQIPRAERAHRHCAVAEWIESVGGLEDQAELLAFHWRSALLLARAAGQDAAALELPARQALGVAGERAFSLGAFEHAADYFESALELCDDEDRSLLLFGRARALFWTGTQDREEALEVARIALYAAGDGEHAAEAEILLARTMWEQGRRDAGDAYLERAEGLASTGRAVRGEGPCAQHDRAPSSPSR